MRVFLCVAFFVLWALLGAAASAEVIQVDSAILLADGKSRVVSLPHGLDRGDFDPEGSIVTYRITVDLPSADSGLQGIYISKMSLSGRIKQNGRLIWSCGSNELSELRCLHRPHLVQLPEGFLHPGRNILDIEIFADSRQLNGLSPVFVGSYDRLAHEYYLPMRFVKVDLVRALAIIAGIAGFLSLAAGLAAPRERIFFIFGAAAIAEAAASFAVLAVDPVGSKELTSWMVFVVRFVGIPLKLLTFYEAFGKLKLRDPTVIYFIFLAFFGSVFIALTGSNRMVVVVLYLFILFGIIITVVRMIVWTIADPSGRNLTWTSTAVLIFLSGLHDYVRLGGVATLDGVYLLYYVFPVVMLIMGTTLFAQMGMGLRVAQDFAVSLRQQVAERTAELESALASTRTLESSALRLTANIPFGTFILRTKDKVEECFVFFSERLHHMTGLPRSDDPPSIEKVVDRFHPDDAAAVCAGLRTAISEGRQFEAEARMKGPEGGWRWLHLVILPQRGIPETNVWDGAVIDVTEARLAGERMRLANENLVEAAARQSRLAERERLLQDMHDGFGSQLSSARLAIEQGTLRSDEVARILLECSEDLKIMVDALSNDDGNLTNAIADFRYRIDNRLRSTGIGISWDVALDDRVRLPPSTVLQILRILQEATANALRHANAQRIAVTVRVEGDSLLVSVQDDGIGRTQEERGGRGMANMQKRSREIGGSLTVSHAGGGTTVLLQMKLPDDH